MWSLPQYSLNSLCGAYSQSNKYLFREMPLLIRIRIIGHVSSVCLLREYFCESSFSEGSFSPGRIAPDIISLLSCSISEKYFGFPLSVMSSSLLYLGYNLYARTNKLFFMHKLYKISRDFSLVFSKTPRGIVICEQ